MIAGVDEGALFLGVVSPKNKDRMIFSFGEVVDNGVGKNFPAFVLVRSRKMSPDGEGGVQ